MFTSPLPFTLRVASRTDIPVLSVPMPSPMSASTIVAVILGFLLFFMSCITLFLAFKLGRVRNRIYLEKSRAELTPEPQLGINPYVFSQIPTPFPSPVSSAPTSTDRILTAGSQPRRAVYGAVSTGRSRSGSRSHSMPPPIAKNPLDDDDDDDDAPVGPSSYKYDASEEKMLPSQRTSTEAVENQERRRVAQSPPLLPPMRRPSSSLRRLADHFGYWMRTSPLPDEHV